MSPVTTKKPHRGELFVEIGVGTFVLLLIAVAIGIVIAVGLP